MHFLRLALQLYCDVLIVTVLFSWVPRTQSSVVESIRHYLHLVTEPVLAPLRRILPKPRMGGVFIDFSPLVALLLLTLIVGRLP